MFNNSLCSELERKKEASEPWKQASAEKSDPICIPLQPRATGTSKLALHLSLDSSKATHQAKSALDLWALNANISIIHKMEQLTLSFHTLIQLVQTTLDTTYFDHYNC